MRNRPVLISIIAAFSALIAINTARQTVEKSPPTQHTWILIPLLAMIALSIGLFPFLISRPEAQVDRSRFFGLLVVLALPPSIYSIASAFLGAPSWSLWLGFATTCGLLIWATAYARRHPHE